MSWHFPNGGHSLVSLVIGVLLLKGSFRTAHFTTRVFLTNFAGFLIHCELESFVIYLLFDSLLLCGFLLFRVF